MRIKFLLSIAALLYAGTGWAQDDPLLSFTIKTGICHGAKPSRITIVAKRSVLKKYMRQESPHFDNCNYLLESVDDILKEATPGSGGPGGDDGDKIYVKDPAEFIDLYEESKKGKVTGEICVSSDGKVSFSIGTDDARIEISTDGKISISAKSPSGITHSAEL
ncbi:MAG TPA: hypothetical protein VNV85_17205 [Puia sp.]|jgi:hypothetical protein|nr:hypothetical protein [Puia sp.]